MAKSLHELSSRSQLIVFVVLCVMAVGAAWQVLLGPADAEITAARTRLGTVEGEVRKAQLVAMRLPAVQREVRALELSLKETEAVIPAEKDPQDVLRSLHQLASDSQLDIASFAPKPIVAKAQYTEWPIQLGLEGTYHDLGRFFDRVATMSRLMSVSDLQLKTKTKSAGRGSISASFLATTFVFQPDLADLPGERP
ncbi:MAG: type 4a pilus biogenesis protein PilO [Acidobacteria bacterium]|nr:type 4a pilus biogenesis protein PilO [Acidobacteriota bacterium]